MENTFVDIVKSISPNGNSWTPPGGDKTLIEKDVEFENGDKGYTFSDKFKVSEKATYIKTVDKKNRTNIKFVGEENSKYNKKSTGYKQENPKNRAIGYAMSYTKDLIVGNKLDIGDLKSTYKYILELMREDIIPD